jgi:hypothetical protein
MFNFQPLITPEESLPVLENVYNFENDSDEDGEDTGQRQRAPSLSPRTEIGEVGVEQFQNTAGEPIVLAPAPVEAPANYQGQNMLWRDFMSGGDITGTPPTSFPAVINTVGILTDSDDDIPQGMISSDSEGDGLLAAGIQLRNYLRKYYTTPELLSMVHRLALPSEFSESKQHAAWLISECPTGPRHKDVRFLLSHLPHPKALRLAAASGGHTGHPSVHRGGDKYFVPPLTMCVGQELAAFVSQMRYIETGRY